MRNNFVAKHLHKTCRSARMKDKKNDYSRKGGSKKYFHKGIDKL